MKTEEERRYWSHLWEKARDNVGTATRVRALLGYKCYDKRGRNCAAQHFNTDRTRGSIPKQENQRRLLMLLGGPHGKTFAKIMYIQKGWDTKNLPHS